MKKPNILLFLADQHRYDCVGYKNSDIQTPNIDRLARQGVVFNNAFCPTPVCAPARQSFMSAKRAESIGALWNFSFINSTTIQPDDWNIVRNLKDAGYKNLFIGKWDVSHTSEYDYGFDTVHSSSEYNTFIKQNYPNVEYTNKWFGEKNPIPYKHSRPKYYADKACLELEEMKNSDTPWFMWIDGVDPHLPCRPADQFYDMYKPSDIKPWGSFDDSFTNKPYIQKQQILNWNLENKSWDDWSKTVACYYGMISQIDHSFGLILDTLDKLNMSEDTLVIYTSDHGDMCGSHKMIDKHYVLYDDVIKIPFVMRYPKLIHKKTQIDFFVYNALDIPATICDLCGIHMNPKAHGRSLVDMLSKNSFDLDKFPDYTVSCSNGQQFGSYTQRSIRTKHFKYIWNLTDVDEFYDLKKDPYELENKVYEEKYKDTISDLRSKLKKELTRCNDPFVISGWLNRTLDENVKL